MDDNNNEDERWMNVMDDNNEDEDENHDEDLNLVNNEDEEDNLQPIDEDEDDGPPVIEGVQEGGEGEEDNDSVASDIGGHTLQHVVTTIMNAIVISYALSQALTMGPGHFNTIKFVLLLFRSIELFPRDPSGGRSRGGGSLAQKRTNWVKQFITQNTLYTPNGSSNGALLGVVDDADIDSAIMNTLNTVLQPRNTYAEKIEDKASEEDANGDTRIRNLMQEISGLRKESTSLPSENGGGGGFGGGGNGNEAPPSPNGGAVEFHVVEDDIIGDKKKGWWKKLLSLAWIIGIVALLYYVYSACSQEGASCGTMGGVRKSLFDGSSNISIPTEGGNGSSSPPSIKVVPSLIEQIQSFTIGIYRTGNGVFATLCSYFDDNDTAQQVIHQKIDQDNQDKVGIVVSSSRADEDVMPQLLYLTLGILHRTKTAVSDKDERIKSLESKLQIMTESETSLEVAVNSLKKSVEAGKVLQIKLRCEITDLKDQLNGMEMTLNDMTVENEQLKEGLADAQDKIGRFKKKAEQQEQVIQGVEAEKDEMEKTNTESLNDAKNDIRKLQDTVARYEIEAARQQATIQSLEGDKWMLQCAAVGMFCLLSVLVPYIYRGFVSSSKRSSDNTTSPIKGVGVVSTDSVVTNPSPAEDSSCAVDHPSPPDESKLFADKDNSKVSTTSAAEGLVDSSSEGVTDTDAAAADVSGSEGVSSSNNGSLSATQSQVDSVSDSSRDESGLERGVSDSVDGVSLGVGDLSSGDNVLALNVVSSSSSGYNNPSNDKENKGNGLEDVRGANEYRKFKWLS